MQLRLTETQFAQLRAHLLLHRDIETAALLLARPTSSTSVLVATQIIPWPDEAYLDRTGDHIHLDPAALLRLTRPARDHGWSIFTFHSHPGHLDAWFSRADDAGDARLMAAFRCHIPGGRHGSLVMAGSGQLAARWFDQDGCAHPLRVTAVGTAITHLHGDQDVEPLPRDDRQVLALGADGLARIRRSRIAVVGLGGMGSEVVKSLAHLGVGHLTLIDGDVVEGTNLPRIVGAMPADARERRPKVEVAKRYSEMIGSPSVVDTIAAHLETVHLVQLAEHDLVLSCVDAYTPRSLLNRLAYETLTPVIDSGVGFSVDAASGVLRGAAGRVVVIGQGRPCLACWGHLDPDALRQEALSSEEAKSLAGEGYIRGATVHQPAVMAFNGMVANAAVIEVLRLVAGFAPEPITRLGFSFTRGTVVRNGLAGEGHCSICQ